MRKRLIILGVLLLVAAAIWLLRPRPHFESAWIGDRTVTLWSRLAVVREPVTTLRFGEKVEILEHKNGHALVRNATGVSGWVETKQLLSAQLWELRTKIDTDAAARPVQARGRTRAAANVRVEPRRDAARVYQFFPDTPLDFLARAVVELPSAPAADPPPAGDAAQDSPPEPTAGPRRDEWWLVRARIDEPGGATVSVTGWVLSNLLTFTPPEPLVDYGAALHFTAWFELGSITDTDGPRSRYLAVGHRSGDSPLCDFTLLRLYTWSLSRKRYETAYVEGGLCGKLPVLVSSPTAPDAPKSPQTLPVFFVRFENLSPTGRDQRSYTVRGNLIRRDRAPAPAR